MQDITDNRIQMPMAQVWGSIVGAEISRWCSRRSIVEMRRGKLEFPLTLVERDEMTTHSITRERLHWACVKMATAHPDAYQRMISGSGESIIGDVLLQYAIFNEVKYA